MYIYARGGSHALFAITFNLRFWVQFAASPSVIAVSFYFIQFNFSTATRALLQPASFLAFYHHLSNNYNYEQGDLPAPLTLTIQKFWRTHIYRDTHTHGIYIYLFLKYLYSELSSVIVLKIGQFANVWIGVMF